MTLLSLYGLGFQLLIIAVMLPLGLIEYIIPFFYNLYLFNNYTMPLENYLWLIITLKRNSKTIISCKFRLISFKQY
jgi:hypothetical protein